MSRAVSSFAKRPYGLQRVCRVWKISRSTVYHRRQQAARSAEPRKRGPTGPCSDDELQQKIREVLDASPWVGEGHRKVWARLRHQGLRVSRRRVLRVMRDAGLLAPTRLGHRRGPQAHDRSITPDEPNQLWGTDATATMTGEGTATIFVTIDHCTAECLGLHAALSGTRFEAIACLRQAIRFRFSDYDQGIAASVGMRHDHGSQFVSHAYQDELRFLGIHSSPAFVREPEGNGCAERFIRTLKEQLLWLFRFSTVEELNTALAAFKERYNREWLLQRHGYKSPSDYYRQFVENAARAA